VKRKELFSLKIFINDFTFTCIIGILDFERLEPQKVIVDVEIEYTFDAEFINYAQVADLIKANMKNEKFLLIEDALQHLSIQLKNKFPKINTLTLKITKPSILPDCKVSVSDITHFNS